AAVDTPRAPGGRPRAADFAPPDPEVQLVPLVLERWIAGEPASLRDRVGECREDRGRRGADPRVEYDGVVADRPRGVGGVMACRGHRSPPVPASRAGTRPAGRGGAP